MIRRTSISAALAAVVLAACGSVTDSVQFNVPSQYHSKASFGPFMQLWQTPDEKSVMMLMVIPGEMDMNKALNDAQIKDAKFKKKERITICGNQPGDLAQIVGTTGTTVKIGVGTGETTKSDSNIELLSTVANGKTYFALYAWPLNAKADPQAEAALRGVCPK